MRGFDNQNDIQKCIVTHLKCYTLKHVTNDGVAGELRERRGTK